MNGLVPIPRREPALLPCLIAGRVWGPNQRRGEVRLRSWVLQTPRRPRQCWGLSVPGSAEL